MKRPPTEAALPWANPGHGHFRHFSRFANAYRVDLDNLASDHIAKRVVSITHAIVPALSPQTKPDSFL